MTVARIPITSVVVHPDGALVTRSGPALAPVDGGELQIRELPLLLDPGSVRLAVQRAGGAGNAVRGVYTELDLLGEDRGDKPASLELWLAARETLARTTARITALGHLRAALASLTPGSTFEPEQAIPAPESWLSWLTANRKVAEALAAIDDELFTLERNTRDQNEQIAILDARVRQESSEAWWKRWQPTRRVRIELAPGVAAGAALEVSLSYRVPGASWSPAYVLDAAASLDRGRFSMRALIVQATGEDWRGVALGLCSAPCERRVDVPELASLRLGTRQPTAPSGWRALPADLDGLFPHDLEPVAVRSPSPDTTRATDHMIALSADIGGAYDEQDGEFDDLDEVTGALSSDLRSESPAYDQPKMMPQSLPAPRSAPGLGGLISGMLDAIPTGISTAQPKKAQPPPAPPAPAAQAARPSLAREAEGRRRKADTKTRFASEERPIAGEIDVAADWLDYGRLRLAGFDAASGVRGRLHTIDELGELREASLPPEALARYGSWHSELRTGVERTYGRPMPPHHILPGPIGGSDVRIDASGTVDIPSDGRSHSIAVQSWSAELSVAYRAVPRHDPRAFRIVTATVGYSQPLLPGPVDVYVDGRLEITSAWSGSPGRGQLRIGLGAEDRLTIARNVRYREEAAGLLGGSRRFVTTIEVSVASTLPGAVKLELLERIPVPLDGRNVTVEPLEAVPPARVYKGEPDTPILKGGRSQILEITPGGEARASLSYAVTRSKSEELLGGDHRG